MPRTRGRVSRRAPLFPMEFGFLMTQIWRKLKAEGRGRDRVFDQVMRRQYAQVLAALRPRANPLSLFQWDLFETVSNYFWPGSVKQADRPPRLQASRPYIDMCKFISLDTDAVLFEQLVDFIQSNGDESLRWPKKRRMAKKERERLKRLNWTGNNRSNTIAPSSSSVLPPRPVIAQGVAHIHAPPPTRVDPARIKLGPVARSAWDNDVEMVPGSPYDSPVTKPQIPTLSFACRPGWDLNNKKTWIPGAETENNSCIVPYKLTEYRPLTTIQPSIIGGVLFARVPEKDVEAFVSSFLGRTEDSTRDTNKA